MWSSVSNDSYTALLLRLLLRLLTHFCWQFASETSCLLSCFCSLHFIHRFDAVTLLRICFADWSIIAIELLWSLVLIISINTADVARYTVYRPASVSTELWAIIPWLPTDHTRVFRPIRWCNNSNNNNTKTIFMVLSSWRSAIARVHPVHMMNADSAPGGRQPSDQVNRLGLWVRR